MKQVFYPYTMWEDYLAGMWSKLPKHAEQKMLDEAIRFTGDYQEYGSWMLKVGDAWPISSEHNLSDIYQNRRAWIGHAACFLAIGCPEYLTRMAWGYLSQEQQDDANRKADKAIEQWENKRYGKSEQNLF